MAIQPIDLQTMYSQMQNVARNVAASQFQPQLTQQMRENTMIQQQQEQAEAVQRAANEESQTTNVNADGRNGQPYEGGKGKGRKQEPQPPHEPPTYIQEGYLGRHIDVSR